ncbi:hypothetical protein KSP39_PZI018941 [Platanthera zijinensis]|uniref:ACT domain-containing protein ACR n=1 Tax=Platanthera zijinensis TaxID=2320716 RepID=A0AAP0B3F6_9ASPA
MDWSDSLNEYQKLVLRMNKPRVVIDNAVCATATLVKVDSAMQDEILLETVQMLSDLDLCIEKAYISSDGRWFMNVFYVTDRYGQKVADENVISFIEQSFCAGEEAALISLGRRHSLATIEIAGADRAGLLSDIFTVLSDLGCGIAEAKLWTHNGRIAAIISIEENGSKPVEESDKIHSIQTRLRNIVDGGTTALASGGAFTDRRLHQMMYAIRDYEVARSGEPSVSVQSCAERGYSIVIVQCHDRSKLLFDVICTLTDMKYVVFHGTVNTNDNRAYLEFCIRHSDGKPINSDAESQRLIQCLQAAIYRRSFEDLRLELAVHQHGLLAEATRAFRENGLSVTRAEVSCKCEAAANVFYVAGTAGNPVDSKTIDAVIELIGNDRLKVCPVNTNRTAQPSSVAEETPAAALLLYLSSLVKRNLFNMGLIKSCS